MRGILTGAVLLLDAVTLYLTEDTSFNGFNKPPGMEGRDPAIEALANLQSAMQKTYAELRASPFSRSS